MNEENMHPSDPNPEEEIQKPPQEEETQESETPSQKLKRVVKFSNAAKIHELQVSARSRFYQEEEKERENRIRSLFFEGTTDELKNELLEMRRIFEIDKKLNRLSHETSQLGEKLFKRTEEFLSKRSAKEKLQYQLEQYRTPEKRENLAPEEQILVRKTVTALRSLLADDKEMEQSTQRLFETFCNKRFKEISEENSLNQSAKEYLQYIEAHQRSALETQLFRKLKDLPFEKRISTLKSFIGKLIHLSPTIVREEVQRLKNLAEDYYTNQDYDEAIDNLEKALTYDPKNADLFSRLAKCYAAQEDIKKRILCLRKAHELESTNFGYALTLGEAYEDAGDWKNAIALFQKALDLQPHNTTLLSRLSRLAFEQKQWDLAIPLLQRLLEEKPDSIQNIRRLGIAYVEIAEYENGISLLKDAIRRKDTDGKAHLYLGIALEKVENFADAQQEIETAGKFMPDDPKVRYWLSCVNYNRGNYEESERLCQSLLASQQELPHSAVLLAQIYRDTARPRDAAALLEPYQESHASHREIQFELGQAYLKSDQNEGAYDIFKKLFGKFPTDEEIRHHYGLACMQAGHFQEAAQFLSPASA